MDPVVNTGAAERAAAPRNRMIINAILVAAYLLYGAVFIYQSSVDFNGKVYFTLFDDAMISMRYAKNFAAGHGLVWNPGAEKVEGYSNFLWVMYMAIPHYLRLDPSKTSFFIQISGLFFILLAMIFTYKNGLLVSAGNYAVAYASVLLCGLYFPLNYWALMGMETSALAFLISLAVYLGMVSLDGDKFKPGFYTTLFIISLVRADMYPLVLYFGAFLYASSGVKKPAHLAATLLCLFISIGAMTFFRLAYYHDILPNTYYLKMTGYPVLLRLAKGAWALGEAVIRAGILPFVIPFIALFFLRQKKYVFMLGVFCVQALYSGYVGGDAWEVSIGANRFMSIAMPVFFTALCLASWETAARSWKSKTAVIFAVLTGVLIFQLNFYRGIDSIKELLLLQPPLHVKHDKRMVVKAYILEKIAEKGARIGVVLAGTIPYFVDREFVDFLGKNDRHVARVPMLQPPAKASFADRARFFVPGHLKTDYAYSIKEQLPDIIDSVWGDEKAIGDDINRFIKERYIEMAFGGWMLKSSQYIDWGAYRKIIMEMRQK